ncbi:hypothetical protein GGF50DRAFT_96086 [Schizophyllum commune]
MFFYYSLAAFFALLVMLSFTYRSRLAPFVPERVRSLPIFARSHTYTPLATFNDQVQAGMSSQAFDIEANIRDGDARAGLDEVGTREVMEIMRTERVNFDQARLIRQNRMLAAHGIDPSGMPMDRKAVTHL